MLIYQKDLTYKCLSFWIKTDHKTYNVIKEVTNVFVQTITSVELEQVPPGTQYKIKFVTIPVFFIVK